KTHKPRNPIIKVTQVSQPSDPIKHVADEAVHKELGDSLVRVATTASRLEAEQDSGGGPRCQEAIRDTIAQTRLVEEAAKRLQAKFDEEERLTRKKAQKEQEANIALIETWDDIQAKINADHQLAERLQA
nr:hypothetical protein [Tanacetum cinerariifolium]